MKHLAVFLAVASVAAVQADLSITLDQSALTADPFNPATFTGTLQNTGTSTLYLDAISFQFDGTAGNFLSPPLLDQDPFYNGTVPASLDAQPYVGPIFSLVVLDGASGALTGSAIITSHYDAADPFDTPVAFTVNAVPEPASLIACALGLTAFKLRRRH